MDHDRYDLAMSSHPWNDDERGGRLIVVGMVMALLFLAAAIGVWWIGNAEDASDDAAAVAGPGVAPPTEPASSVASDTLPLSSYPLPNRGAAAPAAVGTAPVAEPAPVPFAAPVTAAAAVAEETTTTVVEMTSTSTTTPIAVPATTVAKAIVPQTTTAPATTVAKAIVPQTTTAPATTLAKAIVPQTTTAPTTTSVAPTTSTTSTAPPSTVVRPDVTSPASPDATLLDVIVNTPDLSELRRLVDVSGFGSELDGVEPRTLLAPSNAAIEAFAATPAGQSTLANPDAVRQLLFRHLLSDAFDESTIFTLDRLDTMSADTLVVRPQSHTIDGADLLVPDVAATNGYVQVVSDVLTGS